MPRPQRSESYRFHTLFLYSLKGEQERLMCWQAEPARISLRIAVLYEKIQQLWRGGVFLTGPRTCSLAAKVISQEHSHFTLRLFSSSISPHKKGFWLFCTACDSSVLAEDKGNKGSGRVPSRPRPGWVGWVSDEGRLAGWLPTGRGKEALYGREAGWEAETVELSWFRVSLEGAFWNGLVADGAFKPEERKTKKGQLIQQKEPCCHKFES